MIVLLLMDCRVVIANLLAVLRRIEEEDQAWEKSRKSKPKHGKNLEESKAAAAEETKMVSTAVEEAPTKQSTQSSGSSRFY